MGRRSICGVVCAVAACGGGPQGMIGPDDDWLITATGASLPVSLSASQPEARFTVTATMTGDAALATSELAAVSVSLVQPSHLATYAVAWPLRNELCRKQSSSGDCLHVVRWQEIAVADASCDGAGTCVAGFGVTVTAIDAATLPVELGDLRVSISGYWRGAAEPVEGEAEPPAGSAFTIALAAAP